MSETKSDNIQLTDEQCSKLSKLNLQAVRVAQDAEVVVQAQKLKVAESQKEIRDYLYTLAETLPINPSFTYDLDIDTKTLKKTK
jgi:hypothetical protein